MMPGLFGELDSLLLLCIEIISRFIEVIAVLVIAGSVLYGLYRYGIRHPNADQQESDGGIRFRQYLGRRLIIGLELLVAADIIRTIALDLTLDRVAALGLLILVRTFLSWALEVEMYGRWPWQTGGS